MKSTENRASDDGPTTHGVVVRGPSRNGLAPALMRPAVIEEASVLVDKPAQVLLTKQQNVIEALTAKTSDETLALSLHVWMKAQDHLHIGSACGVVEDFAELPITVASVDTQNRPVVIT